MEPVPPTLINIVWLPIAVATFMLPGWLLSRCLPTPTPVLTSFCSSAVMLFLLTLAIDATGLPIHAGTVGIGFALISALLVSRLYRGRTGILPLSWPSLPRGISTFWTIPPAIALGSIALRVVIDPLSGYDNSFRWDYLARLLVVQESLQSYPPTTSKQFEFYGWCDGIPPLVSLLNFWIYSATNSVAPGLTSVRIVGETLLIGAVVFRFSTLLWGERAGWPALAALASSALFAWGLSIGQETGLTAMSFISMLYFLELYARNPSRTYIFWAAVGASLGVLSREYALTFPLLGLVVLARRGQLRRAGPLFSTVVVAIGAPWYLRNWILTGNPIYPMTMGGLFPGNPVHDEFMESITAIFGLDANGPRFASYIIRASFPLAGVLIVLSLVGLWHARSRTACFLLAIGLVSSLWLWSVSYTGGGWIYSSRVLLPALALLAVLSGWMIRASKPAQLLLLVALTIATTDASRRAWFLPSFPFAPPWPYSFEPWRDIKGALGQVAGHGFWDALVRQASGRGIIVDAPAHHALISLRGGRAIPLFSPAVSPTFSSQARYEDVLSQLHAANIGIIALPMEDPLSVFRPGRCPFWDELRRRHRPNLMIDTLSVFDLAHLLNR